MNISFFIPAYNCADTIEESINSILETNFTDGDELIIVNDCSTDNTREVLDEIKSKNPVIRVIDHKRNKGGASARNTAAENSLNALLFCLDSDNVLEENSIQPLKDKLIDDSADVVAFEEMRFFNTANPRETNFSWKSLPLTTLTDYMADNKNPGSGGNYLFTKRSWEKAGGYPESAGSLDTWGFGFMQLASGCKVVALVGSYYFHRYGIDSYFVRDLRKRNMSLTALQLILPYHYLISPADLDYIMSRKNRYTWFDNYHLRPIKIIEENIGMEGLHSPMIKTNRIRQLISRLYGKIFRK